MRKSRCSDSQLVALYQNGDEKAFEELLGRHKSKIFTAIYMIVKDRYVAEDLLQETFIKAIRTIQDGRYNEEGKFAPWIGRIAHMDPAKRLPRKRIASWTNNPNVPELRSKIPTLLLSPNYSPTFSRTLH